MRSMNLFMEKYSTLYPMKQAWRPRAQARKDFPQPVFPSMSMFSALPIKLQSMSCIRVSFVRLRSLEQYTSSSIELYLSLLVFRYISVFLVLLYCLSASAMRAAKRSMDGHSFTGRDCMDL